MCDLSKAWLFALLPQIETPSSVTYIFYLFDSSAFITPAPLRDSERLSLSLSNCEPIDFFSFNGLLFPNPAGDWCCKCEFQYVCFSSISTKCTHLPSSKSLYVTYFLDNSGASVWPLAAHAVVLIFFLFCSGQWSLIDHRRELLVGLTWPPRYSLVAFAMIMSKSDALITPAHTTESVTDYPPAPQRTVTVNSSGDNAPWEWD